MLQQIKIRVNLFNCCNFDFVFRLDTADIFEVL